MADWWEIDIRVSHVDERIIATRTIALHRFFAPVMRHISCNAPKFLEKCAIRAALQWIAVTMLLFAATPLYASGSYEVEIPFRSSGQGTAEIFYDTGNGFTRDQCAGSVVQASNTMHVLQFQLPAGIQIRALRFDPLKGPGSFEIGPVSIKGPDGHVIRRLDLSAYRVRQQLTVVSKGPETLKAEAPASSMDPNFIIDLKPPLDFSYADGRVRENKIQASEVPGYDWPVWVDQGLTGLALLMLATAAFPLPFRRLRQAFHGCATSPRLRWMDRLAGRLSDEEVIVFDRVSLLVLCAAAGIFVLFCIFQLHGSATSIWDFHVAQEAPHSGLLWGHPKAIRSDEITVFTPDMFSQVNSKAALSSVNRTVGGLQSVLFWGFPVNHFIEIPRFYLWPFHLLNTGPAFSVYWNLKGLILFVGSYLLLLVLTGSRPWLSTAGALWIDFSGYTQWWFSHCLPEAIGFAALTLVGALYLVLSRKRALLYAGAIVLTVSLLNFVLIFYPAFSVPLMWVMLCTGLGVFIEKRRVIFGPDPLKIRWVLLTIVIVVCGTTLAALVIDTRQTIEMILSTVYPGRRFITGGTDTLLMFFTSFIDPVFTETHIPKIISNICEGANFYQIGLLLLPVIFIPRGSRPRFDAVDALLAICALMMVAFVLVGFPHWVARVTLLSSTTTGRIRVGIGLAAVFLLMRHFSRMKPEEGVASADWQVGLALVALLAVGFVVFQLVSGYDLPIRAILMLLAVNAALVLFAVAGQSARFFVVMLPFLLAHNFLINPVATGFKAVTNKNLYREVCKVRKSDPEGKWICFGSFQIANFLKFCGVEVINGNKFFPVFDYNNALDPQHHFINTWNRYAHIAFVDDPKCLQARYELVRGLLYRVHVAASAPAFKSMGVRYMLLTYPPPPAYLPAVLESVRDGDKTYWILRRDRLAKER